MLQLPNYLEGELIEMFRKTSAETVSEFCLTMGQAEYLNTSYFEHWLASLSTLLVEKGVISREELEARTKEFEDNPQKPLPDRRDPELLERMMRVVRKGMYLELTSDLTWPSLSKTWR